MNFALCGLRVGCVVLLASAPWLFTAGLFANKRIQWQCDTTFEVLRLSPQRRETRVLGRISQYYHLNGRGLARLNGRLETAEHGQPPRVATFHRVSEFAYGQVGPYLKTSIDKVSRAMGDTLPPDWVLQYFHEPDSDDYLQVMRVGGKAYAMGAIGMPRLHCGAPSGWGG